MRRQTLVARTRQAGFTIIELMVSLVLMLLVTVATVALYNVANQGYRTVDSSQELQDNARFAFDVLGQALRSAGHQDRTGPRPPAFDDLSDTAFGALTGNWPVQGANNSRIASSTSATDFGSSTNNNGLNGSDVMVARFFGSSLSTSPTQPDGRMIDCSGRPHPYPSAIGALAVSSFYVAEVEGEPELLCKSLNWATGIYSASSVVRGVESLQVMYGYDSNADFIADKWLSAQDVSAAQWANVIAVRVGMVMRGSPGSSQGRNPTASENDLYPLGKDFVGSSTETGMKFTPPVDGRLRRVYTATFLVRNSLR
jgi:type IV pilus assembly protein PilW